MNFRSSLYFSNLVSIAFAWGDTHPLYIYMILGGDKPHPYIQDKRYDYLYKYGFVQWLHDAGNSPS